MTDIVLDLCLYHNRIGNAAIFRVINCDAIWRLLKLQVGTQFYFRAPLNDFMQFKSNQRK